MKYADQATGRDKDKNNVHYEMEFRKKLQSGGYEPVVIFQNLDFALILKIESKIRCSVQYDLREMWKAWPFQGGMLQYSAKTRRLFRFDSE